METFHIENGDKFLVLDVEKTTVFEVDRCFIDMLKLVDKTRNEIIEALKEKYTVTDINRTLDKLESLKKQGVFSSNKTIIEGEPIRFNHNKITMMIIHGCNLNCKYCIGCGGRKYDGKNKIMTFDVAKKIIDFAIRRLKKETNRLIISFTSDGEPLLNYKLIKKIKSYCKKIERDRNIRIEFSFATNATLLDNEIVNELAIDEKQKVFFSIDGPSEIHNSQRFFPNGEGTYEIAMRNTKNYIDKIKNTNNKMLSCTTVLIPINDYSRILEHIVNLGFNSVVMRPVRGPKEWDYSLHEDNVEVFKNGYNNLYNFLIANLKLKKYKYIESIANPYDFFGKFFVHLLRNDKKFFGCPGCPPKVSDLKDFCLVFDSNGDIYYPCRDFVENSDFKLGNVFEDIDEEKLKKDILSMHVDNKNVCKECWARYLCGGGCFNTALFSTGDIRKPDKTMCNLIKHLIKLNMKLVVFVRKNNPDLVEKLLSHAYKDSPYRDKTLEV